MYTCLKKHRIKKKKRRKNQRKKEKKSNMIQLDIIMTKEIIENISDSSFHEMDFKIDEKRKKLKLLIALKKKVKSNSKRLNYLHAITQNNIKELEQYCNVLTQHYKTEKVSEYRTSKTKKKDVDSIEDSKIKLVSDVDDNEMKLQHVKRKIVDRDGSVIKMKKQKCT